ARHRRRDLRRHRRLARYTSGARGGLSPGVVDHGADCSAGIDTDVLPDQAWSEVRTPHRCQMTSMWSNQPTAEEGENMAQKKFLVTGATGDTGGYTVEQLVARGHAVRPIAKMTARNGWKRWAQKWAD